MSRSLKKGPFVADTLYKKIVKAKDTGSRVPIKTWSRASVVLPEFVGMTIAVYNGKRHIPVYVTESMVGHRLGEFSATRTFRQHGGVKAKKATQKT